MEEKYLQQKLRVQPTRGTAEGSVHRPRLLAGEQKSHETCSRLFTLEVSGGGATYWAPPGCPAVPRWPPTGTPWGTSGLVGATAEPLWPSCAPVRPPSPLRAARWTVAWGRCRGWISTSGGFSTAKEKSVLQGVLHCDVTWFLDKDSKTLQPQNVLEQNVQKHKSIKIKKMFFFLLLFAVLYILKSNALIYFVTLLLLSRKHTISLTVVIS